MTKTFTNRIPKKRWLYLLPVFFLVNFFGFMDRTIISIALPGGMMKDLALSATVAGLASGIFALGALFLQIPAGQMAQKGRVKPFVAVAIIVWSICSALTGLVHKPWELLTVRFILGLAEGALSPAIMTLITYWFPDKDGERSRATSFFFTAVSGAAVLSGPLGGALIAFSNWRVMFVILGVISFLTAVVWIIFVKERPEQAQWLSKEERDYIVNTINEERELVKLANKNQNVTGDKLQLGLLLRNKYVWIICIIGFCVNLGQFGFSMWMPMMIQSITHSGILAVGFLSVIPNIAAVIGLWVWTLIATRVKDRRLTTGLPLLLFGIALILGTFTTGNPVVGILMICVVAFFLQGHMPSYYTIPSLVLVKELDGAARGMMGTAMGLGAFVGPYLTGFLISLTGSQKVGMYTMAVVLAIGFLTAFLLPKNLGVQQESGEGAALSTNLSN
jgi:MFS family permease